MEENRQGLTRRQVLGSSVGTFGGLLLTGCLGGNGYDAPEMLDDPQDPEEVVRIFSSYVAEREEYEKAAKLLSDEYDRPRDLMPTDWEGGLYNAEIYSFEANTLEETDNYAEVEAIYDDHTHHNPSYEFASLFILENDGPGWLITGYDEGHTTMF